MAGSGGTALLYDADCGFCRWVIAQVLRWDGAGRLVPTRIQGPAGERMLADVPPAERLESWHLVAADGSVRSGGAAFAPLLRLLPGGRLLAWLPAALPAAADRSYRLVARNRTAISRLVPRRAKAAADARIRAREREPRIATGAR